MDNRRTRDRTSRTGAEHAGEQQDIAPPSPGDDPAAGAGDTGTVNAAGRVEAAGDASDVPAGAAAPAPANALREEFDALNDKYLRLAAEFDNYRKRNSRERQEAGWRAQSELVLGLLEALDDLTRFAHVDPATTDATTVAHGVEMVERKMLKSLSGHGLEVLNPTDQPFDPAFHEAVGTEPALSAEDDHLIAKVYQPGYVFRGQLLRPARVVVKQWLG